MGGPKFGKISNMCGTKLLTLTGPWLGFQNYGYRFSDMLHKPKKKLLDILDWDRFYTFEFFMAKKAATIPSEVPNFHLLHKV